MRKIKKAIKSAIISAWWSDFSRLDNMLSDVIENLEKWVTIFEVETVQDIVEETLIKEWHYDTVVKKYILYREQRKKIENLKNYYWGLKYNGWIFK